MNVCVFTISFKWIYRIFLATSTAFLASLNQTKSTNLEQMSYICLDGILQADEISPEMFTQNLFRSRFLQDSRLISANIRKIRWEFVLGTKLAQDCKDLIPVPSVSKGKDTFIFKIGIYQGCNVQACRISYIYVVLLAERGQ